MYKSEFLNILTERGFIQQISDADGLDRLLDGGPVTAYIGFDPTAASLHVGHLTQIMMLYWLQQCGHRPIALLGGGTGLVGDPSFKDEARKLLARQQIDFNIRALRENLANLLSLADGRALLLDNADWLLSLDYIGFLRRVGPCFSVNRILSFDAVKARLEREQSLSFLEFNYMILQAYDFAHLAESHDCRLQMGGSDQWGNMVSGIELGRKLSSKPLFALTTPLLTTASGGKMGKTASGAIWLNPALTSPRIFWQFWRDSHDEDVARFLKLFTTLPLDEIERLSRLRGEERVIARAILADEVTKLVHGEAAALAACASRS